jgi:hypothetical protein
MQPVSRQRIGKDVPAATNTHATIVTVENRVTYSVRAKGYKEDNWGQDGVAVDRQSDSDSDSDSDPVTWELSSAREADKWWR